MDVSSESSVTRAINEARKHHGDIHILVNNAGSATAAPLQRTTTELWQSMLAVNLSGTFFCCREVISSMQANHWGRIINVASVAGLAGAPYISAYTAAKHGVIGLTRSLALEFASQGITINAICPGYTNTDLLDDAIDNIVEKTGMSREQATGVLKNKNPQQRFVEPEEVATTTAWLCLPGSESVNGEAISLTGGSTQS